MITLASLFDGIGGSPLCATLCGAEPVWASEIEKFPIKVTEHHFPNMKHYGDITKINGAEVEPVDIIVGGSPCQDLSVAGKRAGLAGGRSGLFMEQIRIIKEMRARHGATKPRFMVWENVPGAFSSNDGEDFRAVLEETARIADSTVSIPRSINGWANAGSILADGFSISWRTIDAQYFGVPQRRRRIYLVADFGGQSAPKILFERESVSGNFAESGNKRQGIAGDVESGVDGAICIDHVVTTGGNCTAQGPCWYINYSPTLKAAGVHAVCFVNRGHSRSDGTSETLRANCHADTPLIFEPRSQDGVPRVSTDGLCPTINTAQGGQRQPCVVYESHPDDSRITGPHSISPTVTSHFSKGCADTPLAVTPSYQQCTGPLMANTHPGSYTGQDEYSDMLVAHQSVRRLTPLECERLQGYPDGWTDIPGASDSARYKALGNSFAIPCALFVISGCIAELEAT